LNIIQNDEVQPVKPVNLKVGVEVIYRGFKSIVRSIGTAHALIVSKASGYDWGYVDFAELVEMAA